MEQQFICVCMLLSALVCAAPEPQNRLVEDYEFYDYKRGLLANKNGAENKCYLQLISNRRNSPTHIVRLPQKAVLSLGGEKLVNFCHGYVAYLIPNKQLKFLPNEKLNIRKRATQHYFVGRRRSQTQSQYLNYGNNGEPGKAEAESTSDGSKAVVSGNSGIGQAQSQSSSDSCDECYGQAQVLDARRTPDGRPSGESLPERIGYQPGVTGQAQIPGGAFPPGSTGQQPGALPPQYWSTGHTPGGAGYPQGPPSGAGQAPGGIDGGRLPLQPGQPPTQGGVGGFLQGLPSGTGQIPGGQQTFPPGQGPGAGFPQGLPSGTGRIPGGQGPIPGGPGFLQGQVPGGQGTFQPGQGPIQGGAGFPQGPPSGIGQIPGAQGTWQPGQRPIQNGASFPQGLPSSTGRIPGGQATFQPGQGPIQGGVSIPQGLPSGTGQIPDGQGAYQPGQGPIQGGPGFPQGLPSGTGRIPGGQGALQPGQGPIQGGAGFPQGPSGGTVQIPGAQGTWQPGQSPIQGGAGFPQGPPSGPGQFPSGQTPLQPGVGPTQGVPGFPQGPPSGSQGPLQPGEIYWPGVPLQPGQLPPQSGGQQWQTPTGGTWPSQPGQPSQYQPGVGETVRPPGQIGGGQQPTGAPYWQTPGVLQPGQSGLQPGTFPGFAQGIPGTGGSGSVQGPEQGQQYWPTQTGGPGPATPGGPTQPGGAQTGPGYLPPSQTTGKFYGQFSGEYGPHGSYIPQTAAGAGKFVGTFSGQYGHNGIARPGQGGQVIPAAGQTIASGGEGPYAIHGRQPSVGGIQNGQLGTSSSGQPLAQLTSTNGGIPGYAHVGTVPGTYPGSQPAGSISGVSGAQQPPGSGAQPTTYYSGQGPGTTYTGGTTQVGADGRGIYTGGVGQPGFTYPSSYYPGAQYPGGGQPDTTYTGGVVGGGGQGIVPISSQANLPGALSETGIPYTGGTIGTGGQGAQVYPGGGEAAGVPISSGPSRVGVGDGTYTGGAIGGGDQGSQIYPGGIPGSAIGRGLDGQIYLGGSQPGAVYPVGVGTQSGVPYGGGLTIGGGPGGGLPTAGGPGGAVYVAGAQPGASYPSSGTQTAFVGGQNVQTGYVYSPGTTQPVGQQYGVPQPGSQYAGDNGLQGTGIQYGTSPPYSVQASGGVAADDADSQAQTSVQQINNETQASASAQGHFEGGHAQSQVQGSYFGTGSFTAQAGTNDGKRGAQTQISGGKEGVQSTAQGNGGLGQSQAQVSLSADTGDTVSSAQSNGLNHGTNTQVEASEKGGMADANANGPGNTASQAQIGFLPYDANEKYEQETPFKGGGTASAQSGTHSGQSQTQIQGKFHFGIKYAGSAQAGSGNKANFSLSNTNQTNFQSNFAQLTPFNKRTNHSTSKKEIPAVNKLRANHNSSDAKKLPTETHFAASTTATPPGANSLEDNYNGEYDEDEEYDDEPPEPHTKTRNYSIRQSGGNQRQHIVLDPLEDLDATVYEAHGAKPTTTILQPGEKIPGTPGYQIPKGFRGRMTSIANGPKTAAYGPNSHAQSVSLTPGTGRTIYAKPKPVYLPSRINAHHGRSSGFTYPPIQYQYKSNQNYPGFISLTKSETGLQNPDTGSKIPAVSYSQSSTCGVFTNTCVFSGGTKICMPKPKTNPDGSPIIC